jgi:hypothetical protein
VAPQRGMSNTFANTLRNSKNTNHSKFRWSWLSSIGERLSKLNEVAAELQVHNHVINQENEEELTNHCRWCSWFDKTFWQQQEMN